MKKILPLVLIVFFAAFGCPKKDPPPEKPVDQVASTFISANHGDIIILPTYKYVDEVKYNKGKAARYYHIWENKFEGKYIIIFQLFPKEGVFPDDVNWTPEQGSIFIKGKSAAYDSIAVRLHNALTQLGIQLPECFILAQRVHVSPTEALFRMLLVPDDMCSGDYSPVMKELDRVAIINPLG